MQRLSRLLFVVVVVGWLLAVPVGGATQPQETLTVSVVDGDGEAVGNADVVATWEGGERTVTTASNGRAFVDVPAGADVSLDVEHEEFVRNDPVTIEDASETEVTIEVAKKGEAAVTVTDATGETLSDATVTYLRDDETIVEGETDAEGTFETGVIERGYYEARAVKPGYYRSSRRVLVGIQSNHSFELERGSVQIEISVVDDHFEDPRTLEDTRVRLTDSDGGEVGTFRVSGRSVSFTTPVNDRYTLTVVEEGYVESSTEFRVRESARSVQATTQRVPNLTVGQQNDQVVVGEQTRITVLNAYDEPVEGAQIRHDGEVVAETDANGEAVVTIESAGPQTFHAVQDGVESESITIQGIDPDGDGDDTSSPTATDEAAPGFGPLVAVFAVLGAALLLARR